MANQSVTILPRLKTLQIQYWRHFQKNDGPVISNSIETSINYRTVVFLEMSWILYLQCLKSWKCRYWSIHHQVTNHKNCCLIYHCSLAEISNWKLRNTVRPLFGKPVRPSLFHQQKTLEQHLNITVLLEFV